MASLGHGLLAAQSGRDDFAASTLERVPLEIVGAGVGLTVGLLVGFSVGLFVGENEGESLGAPLGDADGEGRVRADPSAVADDLDHEGEDVDVAEVDDRDLRQVVHRRLLELLGLERDESVEGDAREDRPHEHRVRPWFALRPANLVNDVSRAFFEAPAVRQVCIELPEEDANSADRNADNVGHLKRSLYGTRDAAMNWQEEVAK